MNQTVAALEETSAGMGLHTDELVGRGLLFGVSTLGGAHAEAERAAVAEAVGEMPALVSWFEDFAAAPPVDGLERVSSCALPIVTWEPWFTSGTPDSAGIMAAIVAGVHDDHLRRWARGIARVGTPTYLRFAHEFNGDWYPWTPAAGTSAEVYVAAWRHVHRIFVDADAPNVSWIWAASAAFPGSAPFGEWYPGDEYVDVLGIDGYNWGLSRPGSRWVEPDELFAPALDELRNINPHKPILVAEVASAEAGGSKPEWIAELVTYLGAQPDVAGFVWFDHDKETDWRLTSTPGSAAAMAAALRARRTACARVDGSTG